MSNNYVQLVLRVWSLLDAYTNAATSWQDAWDHNEIALEGGGPGNLPMCSSEELVVFADINIPFTPTFVSMSIFC